MSPTPADQARRDSCAIALMHDAVERAERMRQEGRPRHLIDEYIISATVVADASRQPAPIDPLTALALGDPS